MGAQKRDQLAIRDREEELRIRPARIGAETVDAEHAPASVEQWTARIAARDGRGVQHGVEIPARAHSGKEAAAFHRRLALEDVADLQSLRPVHIHRITDRESLAAVRNRPARQRQRWQAQPAGDAQQRKVAARIDRDDFCIAGIRSVRGHDPDAQAIVHHRIAHDMGVGHDPVRRNCPAGAVADGIDLFAIGRILGPDDHHAHHAARRRVDIGGFCVERRLEHRDQRGQTEKQGEKAGHRRSLYRAADIDRKLRDARFGGARYRPVSWRAKRFP